MIPLRVSLEGFLSYKEKQVIDFTGSQLWMLWGPNGVGKSAIFDAITFALYDRHRGDKIKELINHYSDRLAVELDLLVEGKTYRVRRIYPRKGRPVREVIQLEKDINNPSLIHKLPVSGTDSEDGFKEWVKRTIGLEYAAFTSSVLLLQGKSEQLLDAGPKGRYSILADLIGLSDYQRLFEAADAHRKNYDDRITMLSSQLAAPSMQFVTEESIKVARSEVVQKDQQWNTVQAEVGHFTKLLEQASQWKKLIDELEGKRAALQTVLTLIERQDEIEHSFAEWQSLQQVIPTLKQVVKQRTLISESQQNAAILQGKRSQLLPTILQAQVKQDALRKHINELADAIVELQREKGQRQHRLTELAPIIATFGQIESLQEQITNFSGKMSVFPSNIAQERQEAQERVDRIAEIERALPWLKTFAHARSGSAKALESAQNAYAQAERLQTEILEHEGEYCQLNVKLEETQKREKELFAEKNTALTQYQGACKKLSSFEDAATKPTCELCGQEITREHALQEKIRLHSHIENLKNAYDSCMLLYGEAFEQQKCLKKEITALDTHIKEVKKEHDDYVNTHKSNQEQARNNVQQMKSAFDNIQVPFRGYISLSVLVEDGEWLETTYPTEADLAALRLEIVGKITDEDNLKLLRDQHTEWQTLQTQRAFANKQLEQLLISFDLEQAKNARDEKYGIDQRLELLDAEVNQKRESHSQEETLAQEASEGHNTLLSKEQELKGFLDAEDVRQEVLNSTLQSFITNLPIAWQTHTESFSIDDLAELEVKRDALASYELQHQQLGQARHDKNSHQLRIDEIQGQIDTYPLEACRPTTEVEQELNCKKADQQRIDDERNKAIGHLAQLNNQWAYRIDLEQQKREAERLYHLYKLLAGLLGHNGLQQQLLHEAESVITDLANGTLSGLSHGRMRMELRRESDSSSVSSEKALDLLVYDRDTGHHSISIKLASGSQRFRIAISLALAIGRYSSRAAHHIESVIIDEGFGGLDKAGRDDMVQELSTLGQHLAQIILVSHQDDFAAAFTNRYSFKLVDKASCVTLVEDD